MSLTPDIEFIKALKETGGDTLKNCYQCASCSTACPLSTDHHPFPRKEMIWSQWGLKEKLFADPEVFLCHQCGDCTEICPRGAKPAETLGAIRALWPALQEKGYRRELVLLFALASTCIGLFYGAGLMYGAKTNLSIMEYWRWWVVHLWVEGIFEVFATVAVSFTFVQLGLVRYISAVRAILMSSAIYLFGGIPGTFHHLYFSGTPVAIMAIGACFSALEVVPLVLIGFEAWENKEKMHMAGWMSRYKWPIRFFLSVAFWNFVGAGLFGFLVNPPIALFFIQGLNTTAVHAHGALFGVYGMLSLGLILLILRRLYPDGEWEEWPLAVAFWGLNLGLVLMICLSLLPIGLMQGWASVDVGFWYSRSAEFLQKPVFVTLRWLRMVGDIVFLSGVFAFSFFTVGVVKGWVFKRETMPDDSSLAQRKG